ncbi:MAG: hypothetical protein KAH25_06760 [Bacteroidales bacterium]|nr:hypothetical protein [Bacteroidales bacterium]
MKYIVNFFMIIIFISITYSCSKEEVVSKDDQTNDLTEKVYPGHIINPSIQELIDFKSNNYTVVEGNIELTNIDDLQDLSYFQNLTLIKGNLIIGNLDLENLQGLNKLERVDRRFRIYGLNTQDLSGLDKLAYVGDLWLSDLFINDLIGFQKLSEVGQLHLSRLSIESFVGLVNLKKINSGIFVEQLNNLKTFDGINNLEELNGGLTVFGAENLEDIYFPIDMVSFGGQLKLAHCQNLKKLSGFKTTKIIDGDVDFFNVGLSDYTDLNALETIQGNFVAFSLNIEDFSGLDNLKIIKSDFNILQNTKLKSLVGLGKVDYIGKTLFIEQNESLETLDGINQNISYIEKIKVVINFALTDFCNLAPYVLSQGQDYNFTFSPNAYSPIYQDLIDGNCSLNN